MLPDRKNEVWIARGCLDPGTRAGLEVPMEPHATQASGFCFFRTAEQTNKLLYLFKPT